MWLGSICTHCRPAECEVMAGPRHPRRINVQLDTYLMEGSADLHEKPPGGNPHRGEP